MITWICDNCGGEVTKEDGWIEWVNLGPEKPGRDLRLVHRFGTGPRKEKGSCLHNSKAEFSKDQGTIADLDLTSFLGPDGLMRLLQFIGEGELPPKDVVEMIKRLFIPGYEHARRHFAEAIHSGAFDPNVPEGYYWQSDIKATLDYIKRG